MCGLNDSPQYLPQGASPSLGTSSEVTALGYKVLVVSLPSTTSLCFHTTYYSRDVISIWDSLMNASSFLRQCDGSSYAST